MLIKITCPFEPGSVGKRVGLNRATKARASGQVQQFFLKQSCCLKSQIEAGGRQLTENFPATLRVCCLQVLNDLQVHNAAINGFIGMYQADNEDADVLYVPNSGFVSTL